MTRSRRLHRIPSIPVDCRKKGYFGSPFNQPYRHRFPNGQGSENEWKHTFLAQYYQSPKPSLSLLIQNSAKFCMNRFFFFFEDHKCWLVYIFPNITKLHEKHDFGCFLQEMDPPKCIRSPVSVWQLLPIFNGPVRSISRPAKPLEFVEAWTSELQELGLSFSAPVTGASHFQSPSKVTGYNTSKTFRLNMRRRGR